MSTTAERQAIVNVPFMTDGRDAVLSWSIGPGPASELIVLADGERTGLRCTLAEHRWPAGSEGGLHTHLLEDEGFYVLEGTVTFTMPDDDVELSASAGEFVWHPTRRRHGYRVSDDGPARVLQFLLPGTRLVPRLFRRLEGDKGAAITGAPELGRVVEWAADDFGVVFDVPGAAGLPPRPASTRGRATSADGRPGESEVVTNQPYKSDRSLVLPLRVGRDMMTDVSCIFHAFGRQTGNVFGLVEIAWGPGDVAGPHVHTLEDEGFYILEGELTLHVSAPEGVVTVVAHAGDFVWAPRDMPHYYEVTGAEGARVLVFAVPGNTLMDFFHGVTEGHGADIESDEQLERFARWSAERFGIHFMPPGEFPEE